MTRRLMRAAAGLALAALVGCGDPPVIGPTPGEVAVVLQTPNAQDGAILLQVIGPVTDVVPVRGFHVSSATTGTVLRIVVAGDLSSGELVRLKIPDVDKLSSYSVFIDQIASRVDYALFDPGGYGLSLLAR